MKKVLISIFSLCFVVIANAQETVYPAPKQTGTTVISNATIHIGNGEIIENGTVVITEGKIATVGKNV